jgi:hypothetical protein
LADEDNRRLAFSADPELAGSGDAKQGYLLTALVHARVVQPTC